MAERVEVLLADADVLIDYRDAALEVLGLVSRHVGLVRILTLVHDQVQGLSVRTCSTMGLEIIEPELDELLAATRWEPQVGLVDAACLATARARGWTLVSNDRAVRKLASLEGVSRRRGLGLMVELAQQGWMTKRSATKVARRMQANNPTHLNARVMAAFERELEAG